MSVSEVHAFIFLRPPGCLLVRSRVCWDPVDLLPLFLAESASCADDLCAVADLCMLWYQGLPYLLMPGLALSFSALVPGARRESEHDPTLEDILGDLLSRWGPAPFYSVPLPYPSGYAIIF